MIQPTRRTQPYRRGTGRELTPALQAMLQGRPSYLPNPADRQRLLQKLLKSLRV